MTLDKKTQNVVTLISKDLAEGRHVVFLLGAGASKPTGVPLAAELKDALVAEIFPGRDSDFSSSTLEEIIAELVETRGIEALRHTQVYSQLLPFGKDFRLPTPSLQHHLAGLARSYNVTFISLNFDELLERALSDLNLDYEVLSDDQSIEQFLNGWSEEERSRYSLAEFSALHPIRLVIKPHGTISNLSSLRLTPRSTARFSEAKEEILKKTLSGSDLIVIGCSASDSDLRNLLSEDEVIGKLNSLLWIGRSQVSNNVRILLDTYCDQRPEAQPEKLYFQVGSSEFVEDLHSQLEGISFKRLSNWPRSFLPIVVLTGDRREKSPESLADLMVLSASTSDLTWILALGLPKDTVIRSDKIAVVADSSYLKEALGQSNILVVGSPGTNLVARMVNASVPFPFYIPPEVYAEADRIETKLRLIGPFTDELGRYREQHADQLNSVMNEFRGSGFFDPIRKEVRGSHPKASLDYGVITVGLNPFSDKHLAILVAGTHLPGTMGAVKFLSSPENFRQRPLGGIIRVSIPGALPWPRRVMESRPYWDTPAYTVRELEERWKAIRVDPSILRQARLSIKDDHIESILNLMQLVFIGPPVRVKVSDRYEIDLERPGSDQ